MTSRIPKSRRSFSDFLLHLHPSVVPESTLKFTLSWGLGDFNDVIFTDPHNNVVSRFFRKDGKFYVETEGPDGRPEAEPALIRLAEDALLPAIVRVTALELLRADPTPQSHATLARALEDDDALLRYTAIRSLEYFDADIRLKRYDPVKAVRMEAAVMLAGLPPDKLRQDDREAFRRGLDEFRQAMLYNADFAPQRYNLGNLAANLGEDRQAVEYYQNAIAIDDQFYPAKVNLAMRYNRQGNNKEAEGLLREVVAQLPELYEVAYSLGLLLAEMKKYEDAFVFLEKGAAGMPGYGRVHYNHGQLLLILGQLP